MGDEVNRMVCDERWRPHRTVENNDKVTAISVPQLI